MNWVDFFIIIFLVIFTIEGLGRSFIGEALDFGAFLAAFFASLNFYNYAASILEKSFNIPHSLANVFGFIFTWFLVESILFTLIHLSINKIGILHKLNKHLNPYATIPAFFRGLVFIAILLVLVGNFPIQPRVKKAVNESFLGSKILSESQRLEGPLKNVFGGITQDTLTFLTIKPKSDERVNLGFHTLEFLPNEQLETQMVNLVNKERENNGFKTLKYNPKLQEIGRKHSADMFSRGYFAHYSPEGENVADRANKQSFDFLVIGENLAYAPNLNLAHTGLMNSKGHRANILSEDYNQIGIGIQDGGVYGLMVTQVFSN